MGGGGGWKTLCPEQNPNKTWIDRRCYTRRVFTHTVQDMPEKMQLCSANPNPDGNKTKCRAWRTNYQPTCMYVLYLLEYCTYIQGVYGIQLKLFVALRNPSNRRRKIRQDVLGENPTRCPGRKSNKISWEKIQHDVLGENPTRCPGRKSNKMSWEKIRQNVLR